jgi:hypothetical protein
MNLRKVNKRRERTHPWAAMIASQLSTSCLHEARSVASPATIVTPGSCERYNATCGDVASLSMEGETELSIGWRSKALTLMFLLERRSTTCLPRRPW